MQPMPQSICAIVCIYVCFGPTQRLLPGVQGHGDVDIISLDITVAMQ